MLQINADFYILGLMLYCNIEGLRASKQAQPNQIVYVPKISACYSMVVVYCCILFSISVHKSESCVLGNHTTFSLLSLY